MNTLGPGARGRWTLDYPEDLAFFKALFKKIDREAGFDEVWQVLQNHPEIAAINEGRYEPDA
jgi:spore coat polysaccharide biosynthesis protein SpsF (cytidylyltransferase family)